MPVMIFLKALYSLKSHPSQDGNRAWFLSLQQLSGFYRPDIFTTACDNLGGTNDRTVVVEDAVSGVQAGAKGNFGLVLGIAREGNERELMLNGADIVVTDIQEIDIDRIERWFQKKKD